MKQLLISAFVVWMLPSVGLTQTELSNPENLLVQIAEISGDTDATTQWDYFVYKQSNGYYTQDMSGLKDISSFDDILQFSPVVEGVNPISTTNIESGIFLGAYAIPIEPDHYGYYRIGDTGKLFVVYPEVLIVKLFNASNWGMNENI